MEGLFAGVLWWLMNIHFLADESNMARFQQLFNNNKAGEHGPIYFT